VCRRCALFYRAVGRAMPQRSLIEKMRAAYNEAPGTKRYALSAAMSCRMNPMARVERFSICPAEFSTANASIAEYSRLALGDGVSTTLAAVAGRREWSTAKPKYFADVLM